jgi:AcrR family transcriptional regulator
MAEIGRREAHKQATRQALTAAARAMFAERGYDRTTVRDIADAARVTERTFFRYFASKEDLVLGELIDLMPELADRIAGQPADVPIMRAIRDALLAMAAADTGPGPGLVFSGPPLLRQQRINGRLVMIIESGLADGVERRIGPAGGTRFQAEVLARVAIAALRSCLIAVHQRGGPAPGRATDPTLLQLVDEAFTMLEPVTP